jgi:hypothetical protein
LLSSLAFNFSSRRYNGADADAFFAEYAAAHKKLSELGVTWVRRCKLNR